MEGAATGEGQYHSTQAQGCGGSEVKSGFQMDIK